MGVSNQLLDTGDEDDLNSLWIRHEMTSGENDDQHHGWLEAADTTEGAKAEVRVEAEAEINMDYSGDTTSVTGEIKMDADCAECSEYDCCGDSIIGSMLKEADMEYGEHKEKIDTELDNDEMGSMGTDAREDMGLPEQEPEFEFTDSGAVMTIREEGEPVSEVAVEWSDQKGAKTMTVSFVEE